MRRCKCGAETPMGRPNRYGVRMPFQRCPVCTGHVRWRPWPPRYHNEPTIIIGPAECRGCRERVWFMREDGRWIGGDHRPHRCAAEMAA